MPPRISRTQDWAATAAILEAYLRPLASRVIDVSDPESLLRLTRGPHALDEAGVRAEAEAFLMEVLQTYPELSLPEQAETRRLFARHPSILWAVGVPASHAPEERTRLALIRFALLDQGRDGRDALLELEQICREARAAGVDLSPLLRTAAEAASESDRYGMGSTRRMLLAALVYSPASQSE